MDDNRLPDLPRILFAHRFASDRYAAALPCADGRIEITCIIKGSFSVRQGDVSGNAAAGDMVCNFFGSPLKIDAPFPHEHHTVCFYSPEGFSYLHKIPLIVRSQRTFQRCRRLIDETIRVHTMYPTDTLRVAGLFFQIAGELMSDNPAEGAAPSDRLYAERAKNYVYEHIYEMPDQRAAAKSLGITPEYLCAVFRKSEGRSLIRFTNELKLENILELMRSKGVTLAEASAQYGFSDPNYVSRLYKKYFGENITEALKKP